MHICILLLTLQIVLTIGINGDKLPPDFKKIEPTAAIFSGLPCTKEEPVTAEELQEMLEEAVEDTKNFLKQRTPNDLKLEKEQEEITKQLQSTSEPATTQPAGTAATAKPATPPDTAAKSATIIAGKSPPAASTVPAVTPGATTGTPKSGKLLRRARVRLARREKYTIDQPYLKMGEVVKINDMRFTPFESLIPGAVGQVVKAQMTNKKDSTSVIVVMKAVPRLYAVDKDHKQEEETSRYKSLKSEYEILMDIYSRKAYASKYLIRPIAFQEEKHRAYMALEFAEKLSLVDYLDDLSKIKLSPRTIIRQIIQGVLTIHRCGYGHRDLKPDNIFIRKINEDEYTPVVGDLGSATPLNSPERSDMGTPLYAAPEFWLKFMGDVNFELTDAFSVGAILFTMLFKDRPLRQDLGVPKTEAWGAMMFSRELFVKYSMNIVAADFVQRLCYANPKRRMTLQEALLHPYLNENVSYDQYLSSLGSDKWWDDKTLGLKVIGYSRKRRDRVIRLGPIPQPIRPGPIVPPLNLALLDNPPVGTIAPPNTPKPPNQASGIEAPPNTPRNSGTTAPPNTPRGHLV